MKIYLITVIAFVVLNLGSIFIISSYNSKQIKEAINKETTAITNEFKKIKAKDGYITLEIDNEIKQDSLKTNFWKKLFNKK